MITENQSTKFTPLQQELLKLFGRDVSEEDLIAIKDIIGRYFVDRLQEKVDTSVERKKYTTKDFDRWLNDSEQ